MRAINTAPRDYLTQLGLSGEAPFAIAEAGLMLSALDHPARAPEPYCNHLAEITDACGDALRFAYRAHDAAEALAAQLAGRFGYDGDRLSFDDPKNADLMAVIERRRGLPVALGILYLHGARAGGLQAVGLGTPNRFLLQLGIKGQTVLIDPFDGGAVIDRERLGGPPAMGGGLPDPRFITPVGDIDVLLRLQNNLKLRALKAGERERALVILERMALIAPVRPELRIEQAALFEQIGSLGAAKRAYEAAMDLAEMGTDLHNEAAMALTCLKRQLN
jgi:regulator of sirC expression with transglutaminase-like and TPR domain